MMLPSSRNPPIPHPKPIPTLPPVEMDEVALTGETGTDVVVVVTCGVDPLWVNVTGTVLVVVGNTLAAMLEISAGARLSTFKQASVDCCLNVSRTEQAASPKERRGDLLHCLTNNMRAGQVCLPQWLSQGRWLQFCWPGWHPSMPEQKKHQRPLRQLFRKVEEANSRYLACLWVMWYQPS
jgi:hypothetical protein